MLTNQQEDNDYKVIAEESSTIAIVEGSSMIAIAERSSTIAGGNNSNLKSFFNNKLYYINKHLNVLTFQTEDNIQKKLLLNIFLYTVERKNKVSGLF